MNASPIRTLCATLFSLMALTSPVRAEPARYELDPNHITVAFMVDHLGYAKVLGMFRAARGSYSFDEATATLSNLRVEVDTQSVFSNYARRDQHLKSAGFLSASEFPRMVFTAANAKRTGDRTFEIPGQLELLGKPQALTLTATWNKSGPSPIDKVYTMGVSARGSFKRSSYGMNYGVSNEWVGDEIPLIIEFEAQRK